MVSPRDSVAEKITGGAASVGSQQANRRELIYGLK